MKTIRVELALLLRATKEVVVAIEDGCELNERSLLSEIYSADSGDGFNIDYSWGEEEGTHRVIGDAEYGENPDIKVSADGSAEEFTNG